MEVGWGWAIEFSKRYTKYWIQCTIISPTGQNKPSRLPPSCFEHIHKLHLVVRVYKIEKRYCPWRNISPTFLYPFFLRPSHFSQFTLLLSLSHNIMPGSRPKNGSPDISLTQGYIYAFIVYIIFHAVRCMIIPSSILLIKLTSSNANQRNSFSACNNSYGTTESNWDHFSIRISSLV